MFLQGSFVGVWIGLQNDDTTTWTSGKTVTYTNWSPVEPESHLLVSLDHSVNICCPGLFLYFNVVVFSSQEDQWLDGYAPEPLCTVMSNNHNFHLTGKWYDEKCSMPGYGFVCQKPQGKTFILTYH